MNQDDIYVVGAGGQGKVVISTLQESGHRVAGLLDDDPATWGQSIMGIPVLGPSTHLAKKNNSSAVLAVGNNAIRRKLAERLVSVRWVVAVHPRAYVHPSVKLGAGTVVFAGAVIQPDAVVGEHVLVNTGATIDHDCRIGNFVHLAPGVHLAGGVSVGNGALLGIASSVLPNIEIGMESVIGAGALVVRNIPGNVTACGVPARVRRSQA